MELHWLFLWYESESFLRPSSDGLSETVDTQSDYNLRKKHGHVSVQLYPRQVDLGDGGRGDGEGGAPYRPTIKI